MNALLLLAASAPNLPQLLITFLVMIVVLAVIAGLIYAVETWIMKRPLPAMVRLVIGLVIIVVILIWAINAWWPGSVSM